MKTCGKEDAISDINGSVGEGGNKELVPAWVGDSKSQKPEIRYGSQSTLGKKRW